MSWTKPEPAGKEESKKSSMKTKGKKKSSVDSATKTSDCSNAKETDLSLVVTEKSLISHNTSIQSLNDFFQARDWNRRNRKEPPEMTHNLWKRLITKCFLHNAAELGRISPRIPWQCYEPECNTQLRLRMSIATHRIINMIKKTMLKC